PAPRRRYAAAAQMQADLALLSSGRSLTRMHRLERQMARLTRVGLATAAVILVGTGALVYQQHQTHRFEELASRHRDQLVRAHVATGVRLMDEGDLLASMPWFVEALKLDRGDPQRESIHRYRIEAVLRHCPKLVALG